MSVAGFMHVWFLVLVGPLLSSTFLRIILLQLCPCLSTFQYPSILLCVDECRPWLLWLMNLLSSCGGVGHSRMILHVHCRSSNRRRRLHRRKCSSIHLRSSSSLLSSPHGVGLTRHGRRRYRSRCSRRRSWTHDSWLARGRSCH